MSPAEYVLAEIASQPDCWQRAAELAPEFADILPQPGERVAAIGCGTSWFMAAAYAVMRESAGLGETDAFAASEFPVGRDYDRLLIITRSGTTTEVLRLLEDYQGKIPTVSIIADPNTPAVELSDDVIVPEFADEQSVVQTRFATTTLSLLRAHLGQDISASIEDARRTIDEPSTQLSSPASSSRSSAPTGQLGWQPRAPSRCAKPPWHGPSPTRSWNTATAQRASRIRTAPSGSCPRLRMAWTTRSADSVPRWSSPMQTPR